MARAATGPRWLYGISSRAWREGKQSRKTGETARELNPSILRHPFCFAPVEPGQRTCLKIYLSANPQLSTERKFGSRHFAQRKIRQRSPSKIIFSPFFLQALTNCRYCDLRHHWRKTKACIG